MTLTLRYAVRSDLGLVRGNNEDSVYAGPRLLAIADGMGGHAAGEVASKIVIGTMEPLDDERVPGDLITAMREAVLESNHRIADAVEQDPDLEGMGTTLTALRFAGSQLALVHVGDSRAYLLRADIFEQITHDDTYVQYLVDSGKLTPEEAKDHPRKSVILRALRGADVEPDIAIREAKAGDRYLLCSDGLSDVVSTETIADTLRIPDPQECADRLVELALRSGGPDNVTVIIADVLDARPGDAIDDVPVRDGAFVEPLPSANPPDSAAERAAAISRPPRRNPEADQSRTKRPGWWKTPAIIVGILALIAAALGGTYAWAQTQYYVGTAGDEVAIYQGVNAAFGPIKFSEVAENTDLRINDLNSSWQAQVQSGITAGSKRDAEAIVRRLYGERKPLCSSLTQSPTATSSPTATPPTSTSPASRPGTTTRPATATHAATSTPHRSSAQVVVPPNRASGTTTARRAGDRGEQPPPARSTASAARTTARATGQPAGRTTARSTGSAATTPRSRAAAGSATTHQPSRSSTPSPTSTSAPPTPTFTLPNTVSVPGVPTGSSSVDCRQ